MPSLKFALAPLALAAALAGCGGSGNSAGGSEGDLANGVMPKGSAREAATPPSAAPSRAPIHVGDQSLSAPTDFQMAVLFYQVVGLQPPFDSWARADNRVRSANEFDRAGVAARVQEELLLASRSVAGIGFVEINTSSSFGEYDMTAQGFRLEALDSSRFWTWDYRDNRYKLTMENGNQAQLWKIPPDEAKALIESMNYRSANLKLRIKIVGALPDGSGGGTLQGQIVGYEVLNNQDRKVGGMAF